MSPVFEAASRAYARLTGDATRRARAARHRAAPVDAADQPQTPQEYAAELFERACQLEVGGDALGAMKLFAAAVRVDPQIALPAPRGELRARRRPAAQRARVREEGATRRRPTTRRRRGCSRPRSAPPASSSDAEEVLVMAMALKSENDVLTAELRNDLAEVRRMLAIPR